MTLFVWIVGPDGSGKSTLISQFLAEFHGTSLHLHGKDPVSHEDLGFQHTHSMRRRGLFKSGLAILYRYAVTAIRLLRARMHGVDIVVMERPFLDQAIDPDRYRIHNLTIPLVRVLAFFLPRPDFVVSLVGDAGVITNRKNELTADSTEKQLRLWMEALRNKRLLELDTSQITEAECSEAFFGYLNDIASEVNIQGLTRALFIPSRHRAAYRGSGYLALEMLIRRTSKLGRMLTGFSVQLARLGLHGRSEFLPEGIEELLRQVVPKELDFCCIQSHGRRRWVFALMADKKVVGYLKVAPISDRSLVGEADLLTKIAKSKPSFEIPKVIATVENDTWMGVLLSVVPGFHDKPVLDRRIAEQMTAEFRQVCDGKGVFHGDLTPWNVSLLPDGRYAIVDWEMGCVGWSPERDLARFDEALGWLQSRRSYLRQSVHK